MVVSYMVVDKQCAWQQDRSPEGGDGPQKQKIIMDNASPKTVMIAMLKLARLKRT